MIPVCDLHVHSTCSDGTLTPWELIRAAEEAKLSAVALCDHNTVAGLPEFMAAAQESTVKAVPGVEFSTEWEGTELHILGLFIRPEDYGKVNEVVERMLLEKKRSNTALLEKLKEFGIFLEYEAIEAAYPGRIVNRAVIAEEMIRLGYCTSVQEAFSKWLSMKLGYYAPPKRPEALDVIAFIKSIGAVAVLAHPFLNLDEARLRRFLPQAKARGLDAMEVFYPRFDEQTTALACGLAEEFELKFSGGSDFHGDNKPDIRIGTGCGNLHVPLTLLEMLEKSTGGAHVGAWCTQM